MKKSLPSGETCPISPGSRVTAGPVIPRHATPSIGSIYNSAVCRSRGDLRGVFRCDDRARNMTLRVGKSRDGIDFQSAEQRLEFSLDTKEIAQFLGGYDPRVVPVDGRYYVIWCNNEKRRNTQNVVFPCAALTEAATRRIAIYYGAADTCTGLAFCQVQEVFDFLKKSSGV